MFVTSLLENGLISLTVHIDSGRSSGKSDSWVLNCFFTRQKIKFLQFTCETRS